MKPFPKISARHRTVTRTVKVRAVDLKIPVPAEVLGEYIAYRDYFNRDCPALVPWPDDIGLCGEQSLIVAASSSHAFNQPACGVPSKKARLKRLHRMMMEGCPTIAMDMTISESLWQRIQAKAAEYGISETEFCIAAIDYHASLWRAEQKPAEPVKAATPADRFEKALSKEHRTRKPLPENDRSPEQTARLLAIGAKLGLSEEEVRRDVIMEPVTKRKGGQEQ